MSERSIYLLIALLLGGLTYLFADGSRSNYVESFRYGDFERWARSPGTLTSLEVKLASSGKNTGYVVVCEYIFTFDNRSVTGDTCDLGNVSLLGEAAAKTKAEAIAHIAGPATWRAVRHGRFDGWALDVGHLPVTVRHSTVDPTASMLTSTAPQPAYLYWLTIVLTAVLGIASGLGCLLFLLLAWAANSGDWLHDPHWCELLFRDHPKRELRAWARSMRFFRFIRGSGGGMDDYGDRLSVALRADTQEDVERIFATLGVSVRPLPLDAATNGKGYIAFTGNGTDGEASESPAPGMVTIAGVRVAVYRTPGRVELSITDLEKPTEVTQAAVDAAREVEVLLSGLAGRIIDPPQEDKHCVSPVFYPSFWQDTPPPSPQPSIAEVEAAAEKMRSLANGMACVAVALSFAAISAWRELGWPLPWSPPLGTVATTNEVFVYLHEIGGAELTIGVFLIPALALLFGAWLANRTAKRQSRRMRRRLSRRR